MNPNVNEDDAKKAYEGLEKLRLGLGVRGQQVFDTFWFQLRSIDLAKALGIALEFFRREDLEEFVKIRWARRCADLALRNSLNQGDIELHREIIEGALDYSKRHVNQQNMNLELLWYPSDVYKNREYDTETAPLEIETILHEFNMEHLDEGDDVTIQSAYEYWDGKRGDRTLSRELQRRMSNLGVMLYARESMADNRATMYTEITESIRRELKENFDTDLMGLLIECFSLGVIHEQAEGHLKNWFDEEENPVVDILRKWMKKEEVEKELELHRAILDKLFSGTDSKPDLGDNPQFHMQEICKTFSKSGFSFQRTKQAKPPA